MSKPAGMAQMSTGGAGEHHLRMPAAHGAGDHQVIKGAAAPPERQLNGFVRSVALIERVGNALGTLAFTWATVVLLGGYPTVLRPKDDFWFATTIVFLEAARMFSRNNRLDYQLFFHTRGAVRPLGWNGLIIIVCLSNVLNYLGIIISKKFPHAPHPGLKRYSSSEIMELRILLIGVLILTAALGRFPSLGSLKLLANESLRRATSLWSPIVAIILLAPSILYRYRHGSVVVKANFRNTMARWIVFLLLFLVVFLLTISRLHFLTITKQVDRALGSKQVFWRRMIMNLCMISALLMIALVHDDPLYRSLLISYEIYAVLVVSFGNLQIPVAGLRVMLALLRLIQHNYNGDGEDPNMENLGDKTNLAPSLNIFYVMVLGQGILYLVACMLDIFSFIPRRSLARRAGFRGQRGLESINLYHGYVLEKCMERDVLAPKNISLCSFAIDSLNSDSHKMQLHGVQVMHILLQKDLITRTQLLAKLTTSTRTIARLFRMLDWMSPRDAIIRLFAAKVGAELAKSLRVVTIPGTIQVVSALLDYGDNQNREKGNPLMDTDGEQEGIHGHDPTLNPSTETQEEGQDAAQDTASSMLEKQVCSTRQVGTPGENSFIFRCWQWISKFWSIPDEEPPAEADQDLLPALGMSILSSLTCCDQDNCEAISRATGLIPKIIGFTSYCRSDRTYTNAQQEVLMRSSLKLLHRLTSIAGEIGVVLRHKVSKHPFLLRNLADILGDSLSNQESRKLVAGILRNLAVDANTRQEIGRIQVIITRLMNAFLISDGPLSTYSDGLLRKVAGKALAVLAVDNVNNCLVMLRETDYELVKELTGMIHIDKYRCVAASLLRSMCLHAQPELKDSELKDLSYSLREVLERVMDAEGAELEILIGFSSQICKTIPEDFIRELEYGQIKERFLKRLIDMLNGNIKPSANCPGIRRVILEQAINMMECDLRYASCFNDRRMLDSLSIVEETASEFENYNLFLGDAGFMEAPEPLSSLVARAKQLLAATIHSTRQE